MKRIIRSAALTSVACASLLSLSACGQESATPSTTPAAAATAAAVPTAEPTPVIPTNAGKPTRVKIPAMGIDQGLYGVGKLPTGAMATPAFGDIGWYDLGPRPGAVGPAVMVAHVHGPAGDDVFAELDQLELGDTVTVDRTDGSSTFVVRSIESATKEELPTDRIWSDEELPVLRLITCGGEPDPVTRMYPLNTIVYLDLKI